jgi:LPXTG-site transpeptidase (sortase) family protein
LMQSLADQNAITGTEFEVVFPVDTFHDPKASPLTYTATTDNGLPLPAWLKFDGATRTFSGLPAEGDVGTFLVRVTAENASGLTANDVFRIAVSKAARDMLYRVLPPAGSREISNIGQVIIPSGIIGKGTHSFFYELTGLSTISTPEGYSWLSPVVELGIFNGNNQPVTNFANPVEVCFNPTASQRVGYSSENFVIGSSQDGGRSWTLLPTYLNSANGMFCATTAHFSLFTVFTRILNETLPVTGFAPGVTTILPDHPEVKPEENLGDLWVEIPSIEVQETVVGVPPLKDGWDLSWLGNRIGWLNTTAFPTWSGNSILTAHVVGSDGNPGLFYNLHNLRYGDRIIVHLNNQKYIYEVRSINLETDPKDRRTFHHEDYPWLTLVTCRNFDPETNTYLFRAVVRAVQVEITEE